MITEAKSTLAKAIERHESAFCVKFKPDENFYVRVGINRIRFWQIAKGEKSMYGYEARSLANYFGVEITDLI